MRRPGLKNRALAAQIRREAYEVPPDVRAARSAARAQFDLGRLKVAADERVEAARAKLESIDLFSLRQELEDAIAAQSEIDGKLADLQGENVLMAG
ncbi:hypothetical protein [Bradyrhizobium roseum]|uniref:hypothetical protein n=1 Tax=Bradyrhizobium roseum TaxID=3056648 RepID=UPI00263207F7|nr:hypothetical protein [Bradyrhizobium roseus]WKA29338.1 hypothetical protein QUH67_03865 [Bradyrhizobium roseus]